MTTANQPELKHTPGPWEIHESLLDIEIVGPFGVYVRRHSYSSRATTIEQVMLGFGFPPDEKGAVIANNARQMADLCLISASPDLLEACKAALSRLENLQGRCSGCAVVGMAPCTNCKLNAAISKATGGAA